jgi:hypothetical protein
MRQGTAGITFATLSLLAVLVEAGIAATERGSSFDARMSNALATVDTARSNSRAPASGGPTTQGEKLPENVCLALEAAMPSKVKMEYELMEPIFESESKRAARVLRAFLATVSPGEANAIRDFRRFKRGADELASPSVFARLSERSKKSRFPITFRADRDAYGFPSLIARVALVRPAQEEENDDLTGADYEFPLTEAMIRQPALVNRELRTEAIRLAIGESLLGISQPVRDANQYLAMVSQIPPGLTPPGCPQIAPERLALPTTKVPASGLNRRTASAKR